MKQSTFYFITGLVVCITGLFFIEAYQNLGFFLETVGIIALMFRDLFKKLEILGNIK